MAGRRRCLHSPALTLGALTESLQLMMSSLRTLYESEAGASLKQCIGQVHAAFQRATEITSVFSSVKDHAGFFELITTLVSQVKALTPGTSLVIPGGFKGGLVMFVLHADSFEECTLARRAPRRRAATTQSTTRHASTLSSGATQYNTPLLIRRIPTHRVRDGTVWFVLLKAALFPRRSTLSVCYTLRSFPFSTRGRCSPTFRRQRRRGCQHGSRTIRGPRRPEAGADPMVGAAKQYHGWWWWRRRW